MTVPEVREPLKPTVTALSRPLQRLSRACRSPHGVSHLLAPARTSTSRPMDAVCESPSAACTTPSARDCLETPDAVVCAVCLSPVRRLDRGSAPRSSARRRVPFVTACNHTFHRECLVECRVHTEAGMPCPLCRARLPEGLTPTLSARPAHAAVPLGVGHPQFSRDLVRRARLARAAVLSRMQERAAAAAAQTHASTHGEEMQV